MTKRSFSITLKPEEAAVFSRTAATLGAHATLSGPTGAALMGWAASQCYAELGEKARDAFHSGKVRFSDAVRVVDAVPRFANPAILLEPKHGTGTSALGRAAFESANENSANRFIQPEAVKGQWVSKMGAAVARPKLRRRMRTAMHEGKADDGKLFGYQAVDATGYCYRATIETDEATLTDEQWVLIQNAFSEGTIRLGRARATGYGGRYRCSKAEKSPWPTPDAISNKLLRFWLLSDALLLNEWGAPKTNIEAKDFGLAEGWTLKGSETSVTMRRIWPWNATLKCRDQELPVFEAGSVVAFEWKGNGEVPKFASRSLIGSSHQRGFGRVTLVSNEFKYVPTEDKPKEEADSPDQPANGIAAWASSRLKTIDKGTDLSWEDKQIKEVQKLIDRSGLEGPGTSQWSQLNEHLTTILAGEQVNWAVELKSGVWNANLVDLPAWVEGILFKGDIEELKKRQTSIRRVIAAARAHAQGRRS